MDETTDGGQSKHLQPFNVDPACIKCLSDDVEMRLFGNNEEGEEEYIEVMCCRCGYPWNMATADCIQKPEVLLEGSPAVKEEIKVTCEDEIPVAGSELKVELVDEKSALTLLKENEKVLVDGMAKVEDEDTKVAPVEKT